MGVFSFFHHLFGNKHTNDEKVDFYIFGLGNPGDQYKNNRHNIGFRIIDTFKVYLDNKKTNYFSDAEITTGILLNSKKVATVKPLTYMNNSGLVVASVLKNWNSIHKKFVVLVDDFNIPLGTLRIRRSGSHGGHNGLKSIINTSGVDFPRLRVGIGPLPTDEKVIDFVLGNFNTAEEETLIEVIKQAHEALKLMATQNVDVVMSKHN